MDRPHNGSEEAGGRVAAGVDALGLVVTCPDRGHIVRRASDKPAVFVIGGGAGLAGHRHVADPGFGAGAVVAGVLKHIGHDTGCVGGEGLNHTGLVVQHHIPGTVGDQRVAARVDEGTVVDKGAVSLRHLTNGDAVGELTERHGRVRGILRYKTCHAEAGLQEVVADLRRQFVDDLGGHGVEGILQRRLDVHDTEVSAAVVGGVPAGSAQADAGSVVDHGVGGDIAELHSRAVGGDGLDSGAGGTLRTHAVEQEVCIFLTHAAAEREDLAGIRLHDHDGALQLLIGAGRAGNLTRILIHGIHYGLDRGIQTAVDLIAAIVEKTARADAFGRHQIVDHVVDDDLLIIRIDDLGGLLAGRAYESAGDIFVHSLHIGVVINIALIVHLAKDRLLALLVGLLIVEGIIFCGHVGDADDRRGLCQRQILHTFAEIGLRCGLHAPAALAEVYGVEIPGHDLLLVVFLFQLQRAEDLAQLALYGYLIVAGEVFDKLLRDRGAAELCLHLGEHLDEGAGGAVPVNALMLIKTLVFDGYNGLLHIPGELVVIYPDAILVSLQCNKLLPVARGILAVNGAGFGQLIILQGECDIGGQTGFDIVGEDAGEQQPCQQQREHDRADQLEHGAHRARSRIHREVYRSAGYAQRLGRPFFLVRVVHGRQSSLDYEKRYTISL